MDWNKVGSIASVGAFFIAAAMLGVVIWPLLPGGPSTPAVTFMASWGPIIVLAACVLLAGWLHLRAAQIARSSIPPLPEAGEQVGTRSATPPTTIAFPPKGQSPSIAGYVLRPPSPGDDRVFVNKLPLELVAPFSSGPTQHNSNKLVSDYLSKWVRWVALVDDVVLLDTPVVTAWFPDEPRIAVIVNMLFPTSEAGKVMHLEKGTIIGVEGKVEDITFQQVKLINCNLIEVRADT